MDIKCKVCGKHPNDIKDYTYYARREKVTNEQYVKENEGTYNPKTGLFYCDACYIKSGLPLGKA